MASDQIDISNINRNVIGLGVDGKGNRIAENITENTTNNYFTLPSNFIKAILSANTEIRSLNNSQLVNDKESKLDEYIKDIDLILDVVKTKEKETGLKTETIKQGEEQISLNDLKIKKKIFAGLYLFRKGKLKHALGIFTSALNFQSDDHIIWYNKGYNLNELRRYKDAIICLEEAIKINPSYSKAWITMAYSFRCLKNYEKAIECCDEALKLNTKDSNAWSRKGDLFYELKQYNEALDYYNKALKINGKDAKTLTNKGKCLYKIRQYNEALDYYNKALKINGKDINTLYLKGICLHDLKKFKEALKCYEELLKSSPDNKRIIYSYAVSLHYLSKYDKAVECFDKVLMLSPNNGDAMYYKARSRIKNHDVDNGLIDLKKAIQINQEFKQRFNLENDFKKLRKDIRFKYILN